MRWWWDPAARPPRAYPAHITPFVRAPFVARKGLKMVWCKLRLMFGEVLYGIKSA